MSKSVRVTIELLAKDLTKAVIGGVRSGLSGLASAVSSLAKAAAGAGASLLAFTRFAVLGERDIAVASRFEGAMRSLGLSAEEVRKRLTGATGGLLEQNAVMAAGTRALKDGKFSLDQTALAMEFLRLKAVSTGAEVTDFTKNGIDALSRGMARGLLPLFPDLNRQLEEMANSGMEGAKQKSEVLHLVFERMIATLPELRAQVGDTTTAAQQFGVALKDAVSDAAKEIAASPETRRFFADILTNVKDLIKKLPEMLPAIETAINGIARLTGVLGGIFVKAINGWTQLVDALKKTPETIEASGLAGNIAGSFQLFDQLNPGKSPAARVAFDNAKARLEEDLTKLARLVASGAKIEGLTADQAGLLNQALEKVGADPATGLYGKMFFGFLDPDKAAEMVRAAVAKGGAALAAAPVKITGGEKPPKVDLSNLTGSGADVGQQIATLDEKFKTLEADFLTGKVSADDYAQGLRLLTSQLADVIATEDLHGPLLDKATGLTKGLTEAANGAAAAAREQAKTQAELDAQLDASNVTVIDYADTTVHLGDEATTVGAAMGEVASAVDEATRAAQRADLGVGSFEDAHQAADAAKKTIDALAQALMAAGLPADELAAALARLHDIQAGLTDGSTQGLLDMKLLLTDITHDTIAGFIDAISGAFQAMVEGSQSAATAFKVGMLKAIAAVASGLAQVMVGKAVEQIAEALAHPSTAGTHLASAAKFTAAAALFGALSGALSGAANNTGGGGGAGGSPSATTGAAATERGTGTIHVEGGFLDMTDPRQVEAFNKAVKEMLDRGLVPQFG